MKVTKKSIAKQKFIENMLIFSISIFLIFIIFAIIYKPKIYINSCYNGLLTWARCVLPTLLPFLVITKILTEMKSLDIFFNKFSKINKILFNAPPCSSYIFGMSIISGYPVGAKLIEEFYQKGQISTVQANKLITFCSTSGPLFIIGTVGSVMLNNPKIGYLLYLSHIISSILNGILYRKMFVDNKNYNNIDNNKIDYNNILSKSMSSSILSVLVVGGFISIFYMIIDILNGFNILLPLSNLLNNILSIFSLNNCGNAICNGLIEVTRGCLDLSKLNINIKSLCTLISGLIAFGGFSIHAQSLAFLTKCKINVKFYFLQKITQTFFACVTTYIIFSIFF